MIERIAYARVESLGQRHSSALHRLVRIAAVILHPAQAWLARRRRVEAEGLLKEISFADISAAELVLRLGIQLFGGVLNC